MLTNCEVNFYTRIPNLLFDLVEELKKLNKEVAELKEELKAAKSE